MCDSYNIGPQHFPTVPKQNSPAATENTHLPAFTTMSNTAASPSLSSPTNHNTTGCPGLGDLGRIPPELRDEIYRYLVKGIHRAATSSNWPTIDPRRKRYLTKPEQKGLEPATLQLSKATKDEAERIFFSESLFLCSLDCSAETARPPQNSFDRMMKIKIEVLAGIHEFYDNPPSSPKDLLLLQNQKEKWGTAISRLTSTHFVRKLIHIHFRIYSARYQRPLVMPSNMTHDLRTLTECRTLVVEFTNMYPQPDELVERSHGSTRRHIEVIDSWTKATVENAELALALGPATLRTTLAPFDMPISSPGFSRYIRYTKSLEFHPQKHKSTNLSIQGE